MGTTAEKLKYLNETKAEIKNALETPYNVMRDYPKLIKKYIDNQPTKVVTDGICGNAVDVPIKAIEINGNIRQETTEGKNLINSFSKYPAGYSTTVNGVTFTLLENGKIKVNGTATGGRAAFTFYSGGIELEAGDYSFSYGSPNVRIECKIGTDYPKVAGYSKVISLTKKLSVDYIALIVDVGVTVDNEIVYAQLEKGTVATDYELYTDGIPSPSPDYPQEITNVDGVNLVYNGWVEDFINRVNNSNLVTVNGNELHWSATTGYQEYDTKYMFKIAWKKNTQYTFNIDLKNDDSVEITNLAIEYTDGTRTLFGKLIVGQFNNIILTSDSNKTIKYLRVSYNNKRNDHEIRYIRDI